MNVHEHVFSSDLDGRPFESMEVGVYHHLEVPILD